MERRIMNLGADNNGVTDNGTHEDKLNANIMCNNEPMILDPKKTSVAKKRERTFADKKIQETPVVITVQPPKMDELLEKPRRRRERRTSDVIDSIGMDTPPRSPADRRGSADVFFAGTSPSDKGYSSSPSSNYSPMKPPDNLSARRRLADTIDAAAMAQPTESTEPEPTSDESGTVNTDALMPVDRDSDEYNMNHPRRGRAAIFNNDEFEMYGINKRDGSDMDVKNLQSLYSALGFEVQIHHNKKYLEILSIIEGLAKEDHTEADCIVVTVLSHGMGTGFILAKDCPYRVECLWTPFTADRCRTLAGKPKIFFIQACRGEGLDPGVNLVRRRSRTETDSGPDTYKIPTHADFLLAFSSVEGFYSFRNPEAGTWFIECLCQEVLKNAHKHDLLQLLTRTARRVALDHESYNDLIPWQHEQKQVPTITSMLIREVYFRPKK